ncbi:hypothetical protein [Escherichia coli]|uniref:hypothetical protein n=1 Tax=Escherichia coli TaxID=562 RepID=UPI001EDA3005|nr:hypothetical protein [Escherichia coli]MCG2991311.1 hypothetical protein [Escherichia coli]
MKIFRIESNDVAFDEDESMVIIAISEARALQIAKENWIFRKGRIHGEFSVWEIDSSKEQIINVSHYGD